MKKLLILAVIFVLFFGVSCNDDNINDNINISNKSTNMNLNFATLKDGKIILNFAQAEIENIFEKENPNLEFLLVDVLDNNIDNIESVPYLLFKIKDKSTGEIITEISDGIIKQSNNTNIIYCLSNSGSGETKVRCITDDECTYGCNPEFSNGKYYCSYGCTICKEEISTSYYCSMMYNAILSLINY